MASLMPILSTHPSQVPCTLLGIVWSELFFSLHLLSIIQRSTLLNSVVKAVTLNGKSLLLAGLLGVIIVYLFTVFAWCAPPPLVPHSDLRLAFRLAWGHELLAVVGGCWRLAVGGGWRRAGGGGWRLAIADWWSLGLGAVP